MSTPHTATPYSYRDWAATGPTAAAEYVASSAIEECNKTSRAHYFTSRVAQRKDAGSQLVCLTFGLTQQEAIANAAFISRACNADDDLAKALASVLPILDAVRYTVGLQRGQLERIESARAILAKVRAA